MKPIKELMNSIPQIGNVEWMGIRPEKRGEMVEMNEVLLDINDGIQGDHYSKKGGKRMITLIQSEHLDTISRILKKDDVHPSLLRRNIVISGINLLSLHNRQILIGDEVIIEGTGYCHPCSRMETNLGPGGYNAVRGHGGLTAKIISGGKIKIGDQVSLNSEGSLIK